MFLRTSCQADGLAKAIRTTISKLTLHSSPRYQVIQEQVSVDGASGKKTAVTIHVYYKEYVARVEKLLVRFADKADITFLISTPFEDIFKILSERLVENRLAGQVRLVKNRGRNFGPLFVEFSEEILKNDVLIHVHSKRTAHAKKGLGALWADRAWSLLLENDELINRLDSIMKNNPRIGIAYPFLGDALKPINNIWGLNFEPLRKIANSINLLVPKSLVSNILFPAGGMFIARVESILPLVEYPWKYDLFPSEKGQTDGTLQHGLERAVGQVPFELGYHHVTYCFGDDKFYIVEGNAD